MKLLKEISSKIEVNWKLRSMRPVFKDGSEHRWGNMDFETPLDDYQWDALDAFFDRAWFGRLWVWQEILLADQKAAIVQSGFQDVLWQDVKDAIFCLIYQRMSKGSVYEKLVQPYEIANSKSTSLHWLARQTRCAKCSDDRDRVYALLSLVYPKMSIIPDYTKSTRQVYQETALSMLMNSDSAGVLGFCEMTQRETNMPSWVPDWSNQSPAIPFMKHNACSFTENHVRSLGSGIICVKGTVRARIDLAVPINFIRTHTETVEVVQNLASTNDLDGRYITESSMLDAYCRTLCDNRFCERFVPPLTHYPNFNASREVLRDLVDSRLDLENLTLAGEKYLSFVRQTLRGRTFLRTEDGHIGLGPIEAQTDDQICIILGCPLPLVLRPNLDGQYRVVGGCYIQGLMNGEALLGPPPIHYEPILQFDHLYYPAYLNHQTGEIHIEDPRLGPLPENWRFRDHPDEKSWSWFCNEKTGEGKQYPYRRDPRLTAEALTDRGVDLVDIELV